MLTDRGLLTGGFLVGVIAAVAALPWSTRMVAGRPAAPPMPVVCGTPDASGNVSCVAVPAWADSDQVETALAEQSPPPPEPTAREAELAAGNGVKGGWAPPEWLPNACREHWPTFVAAGRAHGPAPALLAMVALVESGCGGAARTSLRDGVITSSAGAAGIMQIMPGTAAGIARNRGLPLPDNWQTNSALQIDYAAWLFASHMRAYGKPAAADPDYLETIRVACIAYNGGPRAVRRYLDGAPFAESLAHSGWVVGLWAERELAASPTFERWVSAGGWQWLQ